jgi:hypothetical protein
VPLTEILCRYVLGAASSQEQPTAAALLHTSQNCSTLQALPVSGNSENTIVTALSADKVIPLTTMKVS